MNMPRTCRNNMGASKPIHINMRIHMPISIKPGAVAPDLQQVDMLESQGAPAPVPLMVQRNSRGAPLQISTEPSVRSAKVNASWGLNLS